MSVKKIRFLSVLSAHVNPQLTVTSQKSCIHIAFILGCFTGAVFKPALEKKCFVLLKSTQLNKKKNILILMYIQQHLILILHYVAQSC